MLDEIDLKIIQQFYNLKKGEERSLSTIARIVLKKPIGNKEYQLIYRRISKMAEHGLFKIGTNSHINFILDLNKVFMQRISFPTKRSKGIAIIINGKFVIFEL